MPRRVPKQGRISSCCRPFLLSRAAILLNTNTSQDEIGLVNRVAGHVQQVDLVGGDSDESFSADGGDEHIGGEVRRGEMIRRNVDQILTSNRVAVETRYGVVTEPRGEDENVVASTAVEGVVTGAAGQPLVTRTAVERVGACAAHQDVITGAAI